MTFDTTIENEYLKEHLKKYDNIKVEYDAQSELQQLQSLILSWRQKLKAQAIAEHGFHQPENITDEMILEWAENDLEEFDQHFSITAQREGKI